MNLFPPPNERDTTFKMYLAQYKQTAKALDSAGTNRTFNEQMRHIVEKFPYFEHTNPRAMAIAMFMANEGSTMFNRDRALMLVDTAFAKVNMKNDRSLLVIDIARYYTRLLST